MKVCLVIVILVAAIGGTVYLVSSNLSVVENPQLLAKDVVSRFDTPLNPQDAAKRRFVVRQGESAGDIAERLRSEGFVERGLVVRLLAEGQGISAELAAGEYELSPSMRPTEILAVLSEGKGRPGLLVTIPEGWRAEEIAERFSARGLGSTDQFMEAVRSRLPDMEILDSRPAGAGLEGYLFPESYRVDGKATPEGVVNRMLAEFDSRFTPDMRHQADQRGMTVHQVVILASIVEREAVLASERPLIAGVFYKRLQDGMRLDTDPTVQYAVASASLESVRQNGWWKKELTRVDLAIDSPYNSYRHTGLPPGPICNPGLASIKAVLEPVVTDYRYFVARSDGSHVFSRTLEEHNAAVAQQRGE